MVIMHNKTGNLYQLLDDECNVKINGKWVDAVIYQGKDKETGNMKSFVREKSDFESHFTVIGDIRTGRDLTTIQKHINVLKRVAEEYPGKTIENIIAQMEARRNELNKSK